MAALYVKKFDMINPFVVASSPATQGALNVLKSAKMRHGAIVLRNYGHGSDVYKRQGYRYDILQRLEGTARRHDSTLSG